MACGGFQLVLRKCLVPYKHLTASSKVGRDPCAVYVYVRVLTCKRTQPAAVRAWVAEATVALLVGLCFMTAAGPLGALALQPRRGVMPAAKTDRGFPWEGPGGFLETVGSNPTSGWPGRSCERWPWCLVEGAGSTDGPRPNPRLAFCV